MEEVEAPLTQAEEIYFTHLARIKLSQSKDYKTVQCKTRGMPITLKKVCKVRKSSAIASSETKRKRVLHLGKLRKFMSGSTKSDLVAQRIMELKCTRRSTQTAIVTGAKMKKGFVPAKTATQIRAKSMMSWSRFRSARKLYLEAGIKFESEKKTGRIPE